MNGIKLYFYKKLFVMKFFFSFIIGFFLFFQVSAQKPEFKFETETLDYGKIALNSDGKRVFRFTNVGKSPLIITRIVASCGCTVPKKPEQPIMPGEKGEIEVSYDTKRPGGFSKAITIYSNAKNERKLIKIKGFVEEIKIEKEKSILSENDL